MQWWCKNMQKHAFHQSPPPKCFPSLGHPNGFQQFGWSLQGKGTGLGKTAVYELTGVFHGKNPGKTQQKRQNAVGTMAKYGKI